MIYFSDETGFNVNLNNNKFKFLSTLRLIPPENTPTETNTTSSSGTNIKYLVLGIFFILLLVALFFIIMYARRRNARKLAAAATESDVVPANNKYRFY
jgi:flagellar biosynthesis/type III secretory pathway M-ring protein FliF/YscJ